MATTFQAEVTALTNITIGSAGAPTDGQIDNWCTEGAKDIIRRVEKSSPEAMGLYASDLTLVENLPPSHTGVSVGDAGGWLRFIQASHGYVAGDRLMIKNGTGLVADLENVYATVSSTGWALGHFGLEGIVTPPAWTGNETCDVGPPEDQQILSVAIDSGIVLDVTRSVFESSVVTLKTCERLTQKEYYLADEQEGIHYRSKYNPGYYFDGKRMHFVPSLDVASGEVGYVRAIEYPPSIDSGTINIGDLTNFDVSKQHLISVYASIKALEFMIATVDPSSTLDEFTPLLSAPGVPTAPTYTFSNATLMSVPGSFLNTALLPMQSLSTPRYNGGQAIGLSTSLQAFDAFHPTFTLAALEDDIANLSTVEMDFPIGAIDYSDITDTTVSGAASDLETSIGALTAPSYTQPSSTGLIPPWTFDASPDITGITKPDPTSDFETGIAAAETLGTTTLAALNAVPLPEPWNEQSETQVDPATSSPGFEETIGVSWEAVNDALENEDFEEASAHISKITTRVSNQQQMFSDSMEEYTKKIDRLKLSYNTYVEDPNGKIGRTMKIYEANVADYQMQVENVYAIYTHDLSRETSKWTQLASNRISLFTQEMANEVNVFNKEQAEYEKKVEALIGDTRNTIDVAVKNAEIAKDQKEINAINTYKAGVDRYSHDISAYNSAVTKYSGDVQYYVERYNAHFASHSDTWKSRQQNILEENKSAAAEALNIFNADNAKYQAEVQAITTEFNSEAEALIKKMEVDTDLATQNQAKHLEADIQKYNAIMDRYVGEVQKFQHEIGYEVNTYAQKIAKEQQDQSSLQLEYTWYQDKYNRLVGEYEASFGAGAPAPPQAAPQGA